VSSNSVNRSRDRSEAPDNGGSGAKPRSANKQPLAVVLLIRSLALGGAQRQLVQLALGLRERGHRVTVGVFYSGGPLVAELEQADVPVIDLGKGGRWNNLGFLLRLRRMIAGSKPDVVYSFVGSANIFAALARPLVRGIKLVWSVRSSDMDLTRYDWAHRLAFAIECKLSPAADLIIANSRAGLEFAAERGFLRQRIAVVPNGIDISRFRPDAALRKAQRVRWGLTDDELAVGMLARLDPMKGYPDFLQAAAQVARGRSDVKFVCIGGGPEEEALKALAGQLGIAERVLFPGPTADPVAALNGLDLFCSASITEGFSNSIAEAMACGLRCVVTDVGDSALLVDGCGLVVPRSSPALLAEGIGRQLETLGDGEFKDGRARIAAEYSIAAMVDRTVALFQGVTGSRRAPITG
jgi:glycosyltransferase involved in cell wall biosynthesis